MRSNLGFVLLTSWLTFVLIFEAYDKLHRNHSLEEIKQMMNNRVGFGNMKGRKMQSIDICEVKEVDIAQFLKSAAKSDSDLKEPKEKEKPKKIDKM